MQDFLHKKVGKYKRKRENSTARKLGKMDFVRKNKIKQKNRIKLWGELISKTKKYTIFRETVARDLLLYKT